MTIQHASLTDPNLHEPKGAATAAVQTIYVADGAGSGNWLPRGGVVHSSFITDVSTSSSVYIPMTVGGRVAKVVVTLQSAISAANAILTVYNAAGDSMGTITVVQAGSAAGSTFNLDPTTNNTVTANSSVRVATDGGSTDVSRINVAVLVRPE